MFNLAQRIIGKLTLFILGFRINTPVNKVFRQEVNNLMKKKFNQLFGN